MRKQKTRKHAPQKTSSVEKIQAPILPTKKPRAKKYIGSRKIIYFTLGFILVFLYGIGKLDNMTKYTFTYQPHVVAGKQGVPTFIAIKNNNIFLPIRETSVTNGIWQAAADGASHLASSGRPGGNGIVIIYAPNTMTQFGSLPSMRVGEPIIISTADGKTYTYTVTQTSVVAPTDAAVLKDHQGDTLIMYTSYGFADLERFVVIAKPA